MVQTNITAESDERAIVITHVFDAPRETWKRLVELVEEQRMESEGEED